MTGREVRFVDRDHWDPALVTGDPGYVGLDGRHWLSYRIREWEFSAPCETIRRD